MNTISYMIGYKRSLYNQYIKVVVLGHVARRLLLGQMRWKGVGGFLRRLLFFLSKMKDNKYVKSGSDTKMNLYVPAFPTKAFFKACNKVASVEKKMPCVSVLLSVTSGCRFRCEHCYQKRDVGKDVKIDCLLDVVRTLDRMGVAFFNIEGGEPFLVYERLKAVCAAITTGEIWVNSTGDGMNRERLRELRSLGVKGIMFSLHSPDPEAINRFMGRSDAWDNLRTGMALCHECGLDVAVNSCLMKKDYYDGSFQRLMDLARSLGVCIMQLIKPKPSGGWLGSDMDTFSQDDLAHVEQLAFEYNNMSTYKDYPFIAAQIADERKDMFGCTAGGTDRFYVNAKGDVQPCEFLNISFGNIQQEPFETIYERMRTVFEVPGDSWLCEKYAHDIYALYQAGAVKALPLDPDQSARIYRQWDRGSCPDFYEKVVKL
jgi:MoaA/NifB/PqqE/SkfB family radical SAM enzyme